MFNHHNSHHSWSVGYLCNFALMRQILRNLYGTMVESSALLKWVLLLGTAGTMISECRWQYIFLVLKYLLSKGCHGCVNIYIQLLVCTCPSPLPSTVRKKKNIFIFNLLSFWRWKVCLCHRSRMAWNQNETFLTCIYKISSGSTLSYCGEMSRTLFKQLMPFFKSSNWF